MKLNPLTISMLGIGLVFGAIYVMHSSSSNGKSVALQTVETPDLPTLNVTAESANSDEQVKALIASWKEKDMVISKIKSDLEKISRENEALKEKINENSSNQQIIQSENTNSAINVVNGVKEQILNLENQVRQLTGHKKVSKITDFAQVNDVEQSQPVNLVSESGGLSDEFGLNGKNDFESFNNIRVENSRVTDDGWTLPIDTAGKVDASGKLDYALTRSEIYQRNFGGKIPDVDLVHDDANLQNKEEKKIPFATIPKETTLTNTTSLTALIGRIPVNGKFTDPFEFKILVGNENLAANGIRVPHLKSMIFSGLAKGNYTGQCISGDITGGSYIFEDGTIQSFSASDFQSDSSGMQTAGSVTTNSIGYIASDYGIQCISGEYISDAASFISLQGGLAAISGIANGYAEAAKTTSGSGDNQSTVVNKPGQFAASTGADAAVKSANDWISSIRQSAFGMVYLPPNQKLSINITKDIPIDYDMNGRKVSYDYNNGSQNESYLD